MKKLTEKIAAAKSKIATKKQKGKNKMKKAKKSTVPAVAILAAVLAFATAGCAIERADPAARSNRTTYGAISVVSGDNSPVTLTIGDGTIASADGEGAITQPVEQTTSQNPEFAGADPIAAGINAAAHIGGKAIDAYAASKSGGDAKAACAKGDCASCTGGECADGNCTDCEDCKVK